MTCGREIENYIPKQLFRDAIAFCHPSLKSPPPYGRYARSTKYEPTTKPKKAMQQRTPRLLDINKLGVARFVAGNDANLDTFELRKRVGDLAKFICNVNAIE